MASPNFDDIEDAQQQIAGVAVRTPLLNSEVLDSVLGARLFVKAEPLQRTGSFKFRGAYNRISRLTSEEKKRGVLAFSSGNHGQAVAKAASLMSATAAIVMPSDAPKTKIEATKRYGGDVILYDRHTESREEVAAKALAESGAILVHPFEDPFIIAGQGTAGLEAAEDLKKLGFTADVVLSGVSGGGLIAGTALAFEATMPGTACYGVEPTEFDDHARSFASGRRETNARTAGGLCDALLSATPGEVTFSINRVKLNGVLTVDDREVLRAMALAFRWLKLVIEPGGAAALAAAFSGKLDLRNRTVVVIASGGNVDADTFERALNSPLELSDMT